MEAIFENLSIFTRDTYLYPTVQVIFVLFAVYALYRDLKVRYIKTGIVASVKRGPESMAKLHAIYVALAFLIVLVTLNVESLKNHKLFFVLLNVGLLAYLCFWNAWSRNKLLGLIMKASDIENH